MSQFLIDQAEIALKKGDQLLKWWKEKEASGELRPFSLRKNADSTAEVTAFFDELELDGASSSVMGCLQRQRFNRRAESTSLDEYEFESRLEQEFFKNCGWANADKSPGGFGFKPLLFKLAGRQEFKSQEQAEVRISDIGPLYDWVVCQIDLHEFVPSFPLLENRARFLSKIIRESLYAVFHRDYSCSTAAAPEGVVSACCFGYSVLPCAVELNFFGFGPGHFGAAIKQFHFFLLEGGDLEIQLIFIVAPRSEKVFNFWGFDPIYSLIHLSDALTFKKLGLRRRAHDRLDALMLNHHSRVHQRLLEGMREVWEKRNWTPAGQTSTKQRGSEL